MSLVHFLFYGKVVLKLKEHSKSANIYAPLVRGQELFSGKVKINTYGNSC